MGEVKEFPARHRNAGHDEIAQLAATICGQLASASSVTDQILDVFPDAVALVDSTMEYKWANRAFIAWFGDPRGHKVPEFIGASAWAKVGHLVRKALAGVACEATLTVPYDRLGPQHLRARLIPCGRGGYVVHLAAAHERRG